ncbi:MAG: T9SS type A sorting domain-containing protein [Ignavibacteriae bacterium]|nr:T9SS type A sorting domain-containing protein [Ignavibacteriota bacterium]
MNHTFFVKSLLCFAIILFINLDYSISQLVSHHNPLFCPDKPKPEVNSTYTDQVFGTSVTRMTSASENGFNGIIPEYSKRQAWNADETLLMLRSGDGEVLLFNGNSYQYIKKLDAVGGEDVFWHPSNPKLIYFSRDSIFYSYNTDSEIATALHVFTKYTWINTRAEGNLSLDGRYYAFVGQVYNYSTGDVIFKDIVLYDIESDTEISTMAIPQDSISDFDWVSVSPLGNYIVVDYANVENLRYHGVEVYDRNMNFIWQKPLGAGHSDLGLDASGNEVLVMDIYDADSNRVYIKKYNLANGEETTLIDLAPFFYFHISCRNQLRNEWCFVSTFDNPGRLTHDSLSWLPFEDEVFALKLDGSGEVQRIAHHHSRRFSQTTPDPDNSNYYAEPHATISRKGNRIIFGSNWEQNVEQSNSVDAYVCDFSNFLGADDERTYESNITISPNPFSELLITNYELLMRVRVKIELYNSLGDKIQTIVDEYMEAGKHKTEFKADGLPQGIYYLRIKLGETLKSEKIVLIR